MTPEVFHEVGSDWVPLALTGLRYSARGYFTSAEEWGESLRDRLLFISPADGSFKQLEKSRTAEISYGGLSFYISAESGLVVVQRDGSEWSETPLFVGTAVDFLRNGKWVEYHSEITSADRAYQTIAGVLTSFNLDCMQAIEAGAALIMARKNSVLAPFERITLDQWRYFKLDDAPEFEASADWRSLWHNYHPRTCFNDATGPAGEKLFAIHVVPATPPQEISKREPEEECADYLLEEMRLSPDQPRTRTMGAMRMVCKEKFGLSDKALQRSYDDAKRRAKRAGVQINWSNRGRKKDAKIPATQPDGAAISLVSAKSAGK